MNLKHLNILNLKMSWKKLLKNLYRDESIHWLQKDSVPPTIDLNNIDITITQSSENCWQVVHSSGSRCLHSKIVLNESELKSASVLLTLYTPPNANAYLQADTHVAGKNNEIVFVGMILIYDSMKIPVSLVSADIGCGLSVLPLVQDGMHMREDDLAPQDAKIFHHYCLASIRRALKRGRIAEKGETICSFLSNAIEYYETNLDEWVNDMKYVLDMVGIQMPKEDGGDVLKYISRFAQTTGSSGNHFCEISVDDWGFYWIILHSGSRMLGSMVYDCISKAAKVMNNGLEIATDKLAIFYMKAYDVLNQFAKLNRIICAISVLHELELDTNCQVLKNVMAKSPLFEPAITITNDKESILSLMGGLTHNGIKSYINDEEQKSLYVLSKGAVSMSKRASSSIVALRAGDGCLLYTLADPSVQWREVTMKEALVKNYETIYSCNDIIFSGHGAGRSQSTSKTMKQSTYEDVYNFYKEYNVVGPINPSITGDNPRTAYKDVETVKKELPLHLACTSSKLVTRVTHKEGISYRSKKECAEFIEKMWNNVSNEEKLVFDIVLCSRELSNIREMKKEQDEIYLGLRAYLKMI